MHGSFDGNKADALSVMLGGVQNAALLFQHAIVAVLHHQAHHGRAEHPGQHLDLPFFRRQLLAGMERIFQQVAKNGAQVGLRQGQELGQFQLPFDLDALFPGLVVVVAGKRIHRSVDAQGGSGIAEFALVLAQVAFQFIQPPGLGQARDHMQVLAEIVPQVAGLFQIAAQLHIAAGLHGQQLVFAVQLGAAGILLCHAVHLVQQQKDAQQRDAHCQHRDDADAVHQDDADLLRHTEHQKRRVQCRQRPCRLPESFAVVLLQQPPAPAHCRKAEDGAEYHREGQADDRGAGQKHRLCIVQLSFRVQHNGKQGAHRHHHCRHGEQKHGLADRYFPVGAPAQQPEADDEQRDEQEVRFYVQHAAHRCASQTHQCDRRRTDGIGFTRCTQVLLQRGKAEVFCRIHHCKFQKKTSKQCKIHKRSPFQVRIPAAYHGTGTA